MPAESRKKTLRVIPVAKRPEPPTPPGIVAPPEEEAPAPLLSIATLKSMASSLVLHAFLLIGLACWYFAPTTRPPRAFDSRLAGSERGVEDGLTNTGGLNRMIAMPEPEAAPPPDPVMSSIRRVDVTALEPKVGTNLSGASQASADGGIASNNPGAGNGDSFGLARFGSGGEQIRGVEVKVGDPQFTLIWDTDVDLDLHVIEPGGKEIYWEDPKGKPGFGGELDVDNTKGYGPENVYWLRDDGAGEKGPGPPGEYKWFVVYWRGFGSVPKPTHWKVRIKHDGKLTVTNGRFRALNEQSKVHTLLVSPQNGIAVDTKEPN
jgi:hypothetical protein